MRAPPLRPPEQSAHCGRGSRKCTTHVPPVPAVRRSAGARGREVFVPVFWLPAPPLGLHHRPHRPPPGAMAAAAGDGTVKPLQCAMKLANGAIELDTGNQPRVRRDEARRRLSPTEASPVGVGEGGAPGWAPARTPPAALGRWARGSAADLGQLPARSLRVRSANRELEPGSLCSECRRAVKPPAPRRLAVRVCWGRRCRCDQTRTAAGNGYVRLVRAGPLQAPGSLLGRRGRRGRAYLAAGNGR